MSTTRTSAVGLDIGSNTISCCKIKCNQSGTVTIAKDVSRAVRLSEGLIPGKALRPEAIMRALLALEKLQVEFSMEQTPVRAVATAVLRMCENPESFLQPAREIIGTPIEIIDGTTEGILTSEGARVNLPPMDTWVILDIGGQSTELCWGNQNQSPVAVSMDLGVVGLTEQFDSSGAISQANIQRIRAHIRSTLLGSIQQRPEGTLVTVGGTATNLAVLELALDGWQREVVHGHIISKDKIQKWLGILSPMTVKKRIDHYRLKPRRADVFPAGMCVLLEIMDFLQVNEMTVSANGLRVGAALSILKQSILKQSILKQSILKQ